MGFLLTFLGTEKSTPKLIYIRCTFLRTIESIDKGFHLPKELSVTDHSSPNLANTSWESLFFQRIFSGFTLPMPANELTESQPV